MLKISLTGCLNMDKNDFYKSLGGMSETNLLEIIYESGEISAFQAKKKTGLAYKNNYEKFKQLENLGVIEEIETREPPHYAIKYRITNRGKKVLGVLQLIKQIE